MASIKELSNLPASPDYYQSFLRPTTIPLIDTGRLDLSILCGKERQILTIPTNGDTSLVLNYKGKETAALSMETTANALNLVQLQGAKGRSGYLVSCGLSLANLFGDQIKRIATHSQSQFDRISMPPLENIIGLYDSGTESAVSQYRHLIDNLGLKFSHEDNMFIRVLSKH